MAFEVVLAWHIEDEIIYIITVCTSCYSQSRVSQIRSFNQDLWEGRWLPMGGRQSGMELICYSVMYVSR